MGWGCWRSGRVGAAGRPAGWASSGGFIGHAMPRARQSLGLRPASPPAPRPRHASGGVCSGSGLLPPASQANASQLLLLAPPHPTPSRPAPRRPPCCTTCALNPAGHARALEVRCRRAPAPVPHVLRLPAVRLPGLPHRLRGPQAAQHIVGQVSGSRQPAAGGAGSARGGGCWPADSSSSCRFPAYVTIGMPRCTHHRTTVLYPPQLCTPHTRPLPPRAASSPGSST